MTATSKFHQQLNFMPVFGTSLCASLLFLGATRLAFSLDQGADELEIRPNQKSKQEAAEYHSNSVARVATRPLLPTPAQLSIQGESISRLDTLSDGNKKEPGQMNQEGAIRKQQGRTGQQSNRDPISGSDSAGQLRSHDLSLSPEPTGALDLPYISTGKTPGYQR